MVLQEPVIHNASLNWSFDSNLSNKMHSTEIYAKYYNSDYNYLNTKEISLELPIFGGFYKSNNYYFILSGQSNKEENDEKEVYRITKYDLNWNRLGACSIYGAVTYIPFEAGSARFASYGNTLIVRTCRLMYESSDGLHHQKNYTAYIDINDMSVIRSGDIDGWVSHSFNQFVRTDGENVVYVDQGDAYPRSIVLNKLNLSDKYDSFSVDLLSYPGEIGDNTTGASLGGFEVSSSKYITVGNYLNENNSTRNIFISTVDKDLKSKPNIQYITDYKDTDDENLNDENYNPWPSHHWVSTPQLVKIDDDNFMLLWSYRFKDGYEGYDFNFQNVKNNTVNYVLLDKDGNVASDVHTLTGNLSDCAPKIINGNVVWYTQYNQEIRFYQISTSDLNNHKANVKHDETIITDKAATCTEDGLTEGKKCSVCGDILVEPKVIPATGHKFGEWTVINEPTGLTEGIKERICEKCGEKETENIPKVKYIYGDADGNGAINMLDVLLIRKYIAKQPVALDTIAADVTCDNAVNMLDALLIRKFIAKQPVTLGPQK